MGKNNQDKILFCIFVTNTTLHPSPFPCHTALCGNKTFLFHLNLITHG